MSFCTLFVDLLTILFMLSLCVFQHHHLSQVWKIHRFFFLAHVFLDIFMCLSAFWRQEFLFLNQQYEFASLKMLLMILVIVISLKISCFHLQYEWVKKKNVCVTRFLFAAFFFSFWIFVSDFLWAFEQMTEIVLTEMIC